MTKVSCTITIQKSAESIWQVISDFGAGSQYIPLITRCMLTGTGTGALRVLTYLDGNQIVERLEMLNDAEHCLSYTLLSDTPFGSCLTTMALLAKSPDQAELTWSANFGPPSLPLDEAVSLMEAMLADNCLALKHMLER